MPAADFRPRNEVDMFEQYLDAMHRRGFALDEALDLIRDVRALAIGSAVVASAMGWNGREGTAGTGIDALLDQRGANCRCWQSQRDALPRHDHPARLFTAH